MKGIIIQKNCFCGSVHRDSGYRILAAIIPITITISSIKGCVIDTANGVMM